MIYGSKEFYVEKGSVSITKKKSQRVRQYIATDLNESYSLGKEATIIGCTIITTSDADRIAIEQLLHGETETTLKYHNFYYKKVITGAIHQPIPLSTSKEVWTIKAEFIALNPIPYSISTDEALY